MVAQTCPGKLICWWSEPRLLLPQEICELPEGLGGVYALMAFVPAAPRYSVYYVGQSGDIARRLSEHTRSPKPLLGGVHRRLRTYFTVARIAHPAVRTAPEAALIRQLRPLGNDAVPATFSILVNPPPTDILPR